MKPERSLILSAPEVRATIEGRKTMHVVPVKTRRRLKYIGPAGCENDPESWGWPCEDGWMVLAQGFDGSGGDSDLCSISPPLGSPGEVVWVKEAFALTHCVDGEEPPIQDGRPILRHDTFANEWAPDWEMAFYKATDAEPELCYEESPAKTCQRCAEGDPHCHWRSPAIMPRWASRLSLRITDVRPLRVQEVTEEQAVSCGHAPSLEAWADLTSMPDALDVMEALWDCACADKGRNKTMLWESNPWVWAHTWEVVK